MDLDHRADGRLEVVALGLGRVKNLHRVEATRHLHQWRRVKVGLELASVEGGGHHDQLQIRPLLRNLLDEAEEDVSRQRALVSLVEDDRRVPLQQRVGHRLAKEHTVRHVLEHSLRPSHILEADRVSHLFAELNVHLLRHAFRDAHGSDAARLRARDHALAAVNAALEHHRGDLRGLATTSLSHKHDGLILLDQIEEGIPLLPHGEVLALLQDLKVLL
mmetsp:Transcript_8266/g.18466  ORF Transcript_8266/g.18466 Transcript_8266/m.18466 type:complete len:218 (-) Transcript_8266:58-711(-)